MAAARGQLGLILHALRAPATPENVRFLNAWMRAEGGNARYNPFNTTQGAPGATNYNSIGVRNYPSLQAGVNATVQTLLNGRYGAIVSGLRSGRASATQLAQAVEHSPWGTGGGVLRVLGGGHLPSTLDKVPFGAAGPGPAPALAAATAAPTPPTDLSPFRRAALSALMSQTGRSMPNYMQFFSAIKDLRSAQAGAAAPTPFSPPALPGTAPLPGRSLPAPTPGGRVKFVGGSLSGLQPGFVRSVSAAAAAAGARQIRIISGYRSPAHNAAVGGVPHSNHITGQAMDAVAYVPGRGWVPLGSLLSGSAGKYGLRSGDQPGFYRGGRDPNHVDNAANQRR